MQMTTPSSQEISELRSTLTEAVQDPSALSQPLVQKALLRALRLLESGHLRVASPKGLGPDCGAVPMDNLAQWEVHPWVKEAVLMTLRWRQARPMGTQAPYGWDPLAVEAQQGRSHGGHLAWHDKLDVRTDLGQFGVRVVPPGVVREGAHVQPGSIVMPGYVNIGAWVGAGGMVDTWATVGSCAQVGKNVHLAGGVGIGGVLEPAHATPVLIGDNAFIGSRAILVEGVVVSEGAVIGANVCLTKSTPIYDVTTPEKCEHRGFVPPRAVVVPGTRPKTFPGGEVHLQCAYIIAWRNEATDAKVSLNAVLRDTGIAT